MSERKLYMAWCANCHMYEEGIPDLITSTFAGADPTKVTDAILAHNRSVHGFIGMDVVINEVPLRRVVDVPV